MIVLDYRYVQLGTPLIRINHVSQALIVLASTSSISNRNQYTAPNSIHEFHYVRSGTGSFVAVPQLGQSILDRRTEQLGTSFRDSEWFFVDHKLFIYILLPFTQQVVMSFGTSKSVSGSSSIVSLEEEYATKPAHCELMHFDPAIRKIFLVGFYFHKRPLSKRKEISLASFLRLASALYLSFQIELDNWKKNTVTL